LSSVSQVRQWLTNFPILPKYFVQASHFSW
jgi:hypothetical protein